MKSKYKVIFTERGDSDNHYKVVVKGSKYENREVLVKDRTIGLYPEFRDKRVCRITDTPNLEYTIEVANQKLEISVCDVSAILAGLLALMKENEETYEITLKGKC